jgi:methyl-accepting chemotaxis protein
MALSSYHGNHSADNRYNEYIGVSLLQRRYRSGLLLALFLPQKIAGPIYRIEQNMLQVGTGNLTKIITLRKDDILKDFAASVNTAVADIGNMVKDAKESCNVLETKIIEGKLDEINKAFDFHKNQLERIITK